MKKLIIFIASLVLLTASGSISYGQQNNFDRDIYTIRCNDIPNFHHTYDDYLQYAPAGVLVLMKACGYESRSSWSRMLTSDAFSAAIMAAAVNGIKYTVKVPRPDGSRNNSFPSGHTATAFMTATMLHKEYGWRSPWISIGGYTAAAATGVSRIMNNRHWMTDVIAGASIGIGAVQLGYYLTDLIFKDKGLADSYSTPTYHYEISEKHYVAELSFGHRHFLHSKSISWMPCRGGTASLSTDIPIVPNIGITARGSVSSLIFNNGTPSSNMYSATAGAYWNFFYAKRFEFQAHALLGGAMFNHNAENPMTAGLDMTAGLGISFMLDSNFKIKVFTDYETISTPSGRPWLNSIVLGWSSAWFW